MSEETQTTNTTNPPATEWFPAEAKPYVEAKGWKSPADVVASYQNIEKLQRTPIDRTVVLPEKEDDPEWSKIHERLGRPPSPDKYTFEGYQPVDGQPDLVGGDDGFAAVAHKLGLSQKAAGEIYKWYVGKAEGIETLGGEQKAEMHTAAMEKVKTQWGQAYEQNTAIARNAVATLGLDAEALEKIEDALGTEWLMTTFHRIGQRLGEQAPANAEGRGAGREGFGVTPAEAQLKVEELLRDEAFVRRYYEGDREAVDRMQRLHQAIAGTAVVRPNSVIAR